MSPSIKITCIWGRDIYVLPKFLEICPSYKELNSSDLNMGYDLNRYLHNPDGPARLGYKQDGQRIPIYALEGRVMSKEEWDALVHAHQFRNAAERLLGALDEENESIT